MVKGKKVKDARTDKMMTQRKMKGWKTNNKDWVKAAFDHSEELWDKTNKDEVLPTNPKIRARVSEIFLERIDLYKQAAELTKTRLTNGEMVWAIQRDIGYNQELYKQGELTEEVLRDIRVHSLKYVIELVYSRDGFGDYNTVKQSVYNDELPEELPTSHYAVEEWLLGELKEFINKIKVKQTQLTQ